MYRLRIAVISSIILAAAPALWAQQPEFRAFLANGKWTQAGQTRQIACEFYNDHPFPVTVTWDVLVSGFVDQETQGAPMGTRTVPAYGRISLPLSVMSIYCPFESAAVLSAYVNAAPFMVQSRATWECRPEMLSYLLREDETLVGAAPVPEDMFGAALAASGDVAVIGASMEDTAGIDSGAAYVYRFNGSDWVIDQGLLGSDTSSQDQFGSSVAVEGNLAVVGASGDGGPSWGRGAAYVFRFDGSSWQEEQKIVPADGQDFDNFGAALALSGEILAIGAPGHDPSGQGAGAVYIYHWDGAAWVLEEKLSGTAPWAGFGQAVSTSNNDRILIGAPWENVGPDFAVGASYVYNWAQGQGWALTQSFSPSNAAAFQNFGASVAIDFETILIGAPGDDGSATDAGASYLYDYSGNQWSLLQKLQAQDPSAWARFGHAVALDGSRAMIASIQDDERGSGAGAAYLFEWQGALWSEVQKLHAAETGPNHSFGQTVALEGSLAFVGALRPDAAGAAYSFITDPAPRLHVPRQAFEAGDTLTLTVSDGSPGGRSLLMVTDVQGVPFTWILAMGGLDGAGVSSLSAPVPPGLGDLQVRFLALVQDPVGSITATNPEPAVLR